ncbi:hypothetical protein [Lacticaseibacillus paracasei]
MIAFSLLVTTILNDKKK